MREAYETRRVVEQRPCIDGVLTVYDDGTELLLPYLGCDEDGLLCMDLFPNGDA